MLASLVGWLAYRSTLAEEARDVYCISMREARGLCVAEAAR